MDAQSVGRKIYALRKAHNMTQQQLAVELYVTDKAISKWENGGGLPELRQIPAIASIFGVTVDDIISDRELPTKGELRLRKFRAGTSITNAKLLILILVAVLITGFIIANTIWTNYISNTFDPFLNNKNLQAIPQWNRDIYRSRGRVTHSFKDFERSGYCYEIGVPRWLNFGGTIYIMTYSNPQLNPDFRDSNISLMIFTAPGGDWTYVLSLGTSEYREYVNEKGGQVYETIGETFGSAVDRNGQPLGKHPEDSEENYLLWLELYEEYYEAIMKLFNDMKEFFGEDAFR